MNALNHQMISDVTGVLNKYKDREDIKNIVFEGAGDRAFCAGGDVKAVYYLGQDNPKSAMKYFADEYAMNAIIHDYPKPIISLCHGYVMGGGYGVAGNGQHIVVDNTTKFAMPETAIGFFPDVGIGWKLARAGALGMYIALCGDVFDADVMIAAGLATHKVDSVSNFDFNMDVAVKDEIPNQKEIEDIFLKDSLEDIWRSLDQSQTEFSKTTLQTLQSRSPISLHITFHHLKLAKKETYHQSIARDYRLACAFLKKSDLFEGIRAQLIDKDKCPKWQSSSIFNISQADIDYYLQFSDDDNIKQF